MNARALWITAPGHCAVREETLAQPAEGEMRLRMLASGISRGTEALVFAGRVPPSQYTAMRAPLMQGSFPAPVKYGYSAVAQTPQGARVFVLHPHQDRFNAPAAQCVAVPDEVPTPRAVLAANMETALNIVWDAGPLPGERICVIGAGVVGLLTAALLARVPACAVTVLDIEAGRAAIARRFGCAFAHPDAAPGGQELLVHATGTASGLATALRCAAFEARIIESSWFGTAAPSVPLGEDFHARRLRLVASQVGSVAPAMRGRRSPAQRLALALDLLRDACFDELLEPPTPFAQAASRYPALLARGLCHCFTY